jgi:hypothetical protein
MHRLLASTWRHWPIAIWDRIFRIAKGLDRPRAKVGPVFRLEVRRWRRDVRFGDGTALRRGDRAGVIHLDNEEVVRLHRIGRPETATGLELRRLVVASLAELARRAAPGGPLDDVRAFAALTIYPYGLERLGFERDLERTGSAVVAAYQRALVAWLFPGAQGRMAHRLRAQLLWIPRERLLARYGAAPGQRSSFLTA